MSHHIGINSLADRYLQKQQSNHFDYGALRKLRSIDVNNFAASAQLNSAKLSGGDASKQKAIAQTIGKNRQQQSNKPTAASLSLTTPTQSSGTVSAAKNTQAIIVRQYEKILTIGGEKVRVLITVWVYPNSGKTFTTTQILDYL